MTWQLRRPRADDAERIVDINIRGWQHSYAGLMPADLLDSLGAQRRQRAERLRDRFRTSTSATGYVVTGDHDVVAGYCWFGDYRPDDDLPAPGPGWAEIYAIYVDPDLVGTGAGGALMLAALADLAPRPVALWVLEGNAHARGFYERFGFAPDGARADFDAGGTPVPEVRYVLPR